MFITREVNIVIARICKSTLERKQDENSIKGASLGQKVCTTKAKWRSKTSNEYSIEK